MENEFPPNAHTKRERTPRDKPEKDAPERKEVVQVTKGKTVVRKRPLYKKFFDAFRPEDNRGFVEYVLLEVLAQGIKDAIADASISSIENALGGHGGGHRRRRSGGGGYTSYNRMSSSRPRDRRDRDDDRRPSRRDRDRDDRGRPDQLEIILDSRVEAEEVLDNMIELISNYDVATKRDLLSLVGEPHNYTDEDWGWTDLRGARIHRIGRDGYLLDLPRAESLD